MLLRSEVDVSFYPPRLQELLKSESHEEGRVPRNVECELTEDLVDSCIPGDVVTVTGIIKVINNYMDVGGGTLVAFWFALAIPTAILFMTLF